MHWCVLFKQLLWRYLSIIRWNWYHDPIFVLLFVKQTQNKVVDDISKIFYTQYIFRTKDVKWSCLHILIFRFIGEEFIFCWKEGSLCFYLGMKTTVVYFHCMKHLKRGIFLQQVLPKEKSPFWFSVFQYNIRNRLSYKPLGHSCSEKVANICFCKKPK